MIKTIGCPHSVIPACPVTSGDSPGRESFCAFSQKDSRLPKAFGIAGMTICVVLLFFMSGCAGIIFSNGDQPEKVSEGVFRGPHPQESDLYELSRMGIRTVLSLEDNPTVVAEEENVCRSLNINFVNVPLSELFPPSPGDLERAVSVIRQNRNHGIYIHCRRGIDRTGYVIASFRMLVEKYALDTAYKECCDHGHSPLVYFFWKHSLKEISREAHQTEISASGKIRLGPLGI